MNYAKIFFAPCAFTVLPTKLAKEIVVSKAAHEPDIAKSTLLTWCSKSLDRNIESDMPLSSREIQMMKEIRGLKKSNAILKETLVFFAQSQKR